MGEVGYLITGVKDVRQSRVGDTVTSQRNGATEPLGGYRDPKPMVFSGLYPLDGSDYPELRDALDKLQLNDAALVYEPETSVALGFGFRCGFLGLLHLEIVRERLEREFNLDLISTAPTVVYRVVMDDGSEVVVTNPSEFPGGKVSEVFEPMVRATVLAPSEYIGAIMELCQTRRGNLLGMDYLSEDRVELRYTLPLAEIVFDFFDAPQEQDPQATPRSTMSRAVDQDSDLVKVDILLQGEAGRRVQRDRAQARRHTPMACLMTGNACKKLNPAPAVRGSDPGGHRRSHHRPRVDLARCAKTFSPSATAVTSPASASCWRSRRRARSG